MNALILLVPLFAGGPVSGPAPPAALDTPTSEPSLAGAEGYDELLASFEEAETSWRRAVKEAESARERKTLRDAHPAQEFWPLFLASAEGGEGRAILWLLNNVKDGGIERELIDSTVVGLCEWLVADHATAPWFAEGVTAVFGAKKALGTERLEALVGRMLEQELSDGAGALALYFMGQALKGSPDELEQQRGLAYLERLVAKYPEEAVAQRAAGEVFRGRHLQVGMVPPDFETKSYDGFEFKLSDFRGKVTVLDFWGFW